MLFRFLFTAFLFLLTSSKVMAAACLDVFPDVQTEYGDTLILPTFENTSGVDGSESGNNLSLPSGEYQDISVTDNNPGNSQHSSLTFTSANGLYKVNNLNVVQNATVHFESGDYFIKNLTMGEDSILNITSTGTVRIYVESNVNLGEEVIINDDNDLLLFISYGSISGAKNIRFSGAMYAQNNINLDTSVDIHGAITAANINLTDPEVLDYQSESITNADFNGMCDNEVESAALALHYLFDEGEGDVANDSSGNNLHAILGDDSGNSLNPEWQCALTGSYLTFEASGSDSDRVERESFTPPLETSISFWMKVPEIPDSTQRIFGMARGWEARWGEAEIGGDTNDGYVYFDINFDDNDSDDLSAIRTNRRFTSDDVGEWFHFTFKGSESSENWEVYVNGTLDNSGSANFESQSLEDDLWIGGSSWRTNGESLTGSLDDFRLYNGLLSESEISTLASTPPQDCIVNNYLAYYAFEQDGFDNDIIFDTSGSSNDALNIKNGTSVEEGKYCRGYNSNGSNNNSKSEYGFNTQINVNDDIGNAGTVNFWFRSEKNWGDHSRTLFDASSEEDDKYFYLEIENNSGNLRFKFEDDDDDDFTVEEDSNNRDANVWYYISVTWDLSNDEFEIYVDGSSVVKSDDEDTTGSLGDLGALIIGDYASGYDQAPKRNAQGDFDEVRIYSEVRTQAQIQTDMNDSSCIADVLELHYEFNEGTGQTAYDSSGNNRDATLGASGAEEDTDPTWQCEADGFYLNFDDSEQQFATSPEFAPPETTTVAFWMKIPDLPSIQQRIFGFGRDWEARLSYDGLIYWDINSDRDSFSTFFSDLSDFIDLFDDDDGRMKTGSVIASYEYNQWIHFAFSSNTSDGTWAVYKNGVLDNSGVQDLVAQPSSELTLGKRTENALVSYYYDGALEDFRIYSNILSVSTIEELAANPPQECEGVIDHYEIHHSLTGLTCASESITVKACTSDAGVTCQESTEAINLTLNAVNTDTVSKALSFTGNTDTNLNYTIAESVTLSISDAVPSAADEFVCIQKGTSTTTSCNISFADSGFRFLSGNSENLPTQLSGKPSNTGYNTSTWTIQAIQKNTTTGVCEGALVGDVAIDLRAICNEPNTCVAASDVQITGSDNSTTTIETQDFDALASFTEVTLDFGDDSTSTAGFIFMYPDAGQLTLDAQYLIPPDEDNSNPTPQHMQGTSNPFVVKPFGFYIGKDNIVEAANTGNENPAAETPSGDKFISAGTEFEVDITAMQWSSGQDANNNGIHDDDDDISNNDITPNFNMVVELTHDLAELDPVLNDLVPGTLAVTDNQGSEGIFNNGVATLAAKYSEVGIIELLVNNDGEYINGSGVSDIQGNEPFVGRFIPDYFEQTINDEGTLLGNHHSTCSAENWVYAGQENTDDDTGAIQYEETPIINIIAYNADGEPTANYTVGDFRKLTAGDVFAGLILPESDANQYRVGESESVDEDIPDGEKVAIDADMSEGILENDVDEVPSVMNYTYNETDSFIYEHNDNSLLSPFSAIIPFNVRVFPLVDEDDTGILITDSDGVTLAADEEGETLHSAVEHFTSDGVEVYFGRWFIENAYGPETSNLIVPMFIQRYDETSESFITHISDNCTLPLLGNKSSSGDLHSGNLSPWDYRLVDQGTNVTPADTDASIPSPAQEVESGEYRSFVFSEPLKQGALQVEYEVPAWFKFNWQGDSDDDGEFVDNPSAMITFGIYRGNDRIISWREVGN